VDDKLIGLVGFLGPAAQPFEDTTTLVEAAPDGWSYSALLPDRRLVAVYFTDADLVEGNGGASSAFWRKQLSGARETTARIEHHEGALPSKIRVVSAGSSCLETMAGSTWLAVGDAALSYDPLSACGIVTAMAGGMEGAAAIQQQMQGDDGATERYAAHMQQCYERYRSMLAAYYREETRWADRPFWKRRSTDRAVTADNRGGIIMAARQ
jgi:2-polyprenyl-6-methoxyphenol hydroxylase-like FAD-dependent oxidoreductase